MPIGLDTAYISIAYVLVRDAHEGLLEGVKYNFCIQISARSR